ncbi:MAG: MBL fold metallo-hydrolase [Patescibacteria group bacterium]
MHRDDARLTVSFLDVGQGDSILVRGPTGIEMLIDGGRDRSVLRRLPGVIGPFDRSIDLVVETHPDADHIAGLADVLERYRVHYFLSPGIENDTATTKRLLADVAKERGLTAFTARKGERIHLGGGAYADVLYPDHDVSKSETNAGSVVLHIVYGGTSFMLTGDLPSSGEDHLVTEDGATLKSDVLKAGHHGSRTSTDSGWLAAVGPSTVVISAGKDNSYGHPHPETLDRIRLQGAAILSTIDEGTITFTSDGVTLLRKKSAF